MDYILNRKVQEARKYHIKTYVEVLVPSQLNISEDTLCTIIMNLLDNAIEAAKQVPETRERKIEVLFTSKNECAIMHIKNSVIENIDHNQPLGTTKKDKKRHGIGMMSMQNAVSKYGGTMEWKCQNYEFHLIVALPI